MHAKVDGEIKYLRDAAPEPGTVVPLLPGLTWVRVPLPFVLNHVNCWLLDDGGKSGGVTLVDTGADKKETRELWNRVFAETLVDRKISRLICTHGHPDHVGLAGWLVEKLGVQLHMTLGEWLAPQVWREEGLKPMRPEVKAFFMSHGVPEAAVMKMEKAREIAPFRNHPMPANFVRLRDNHSTSLMTGIFSLMG